MVVSLWRAGENTALTPNSTKKFTPISTTNNNVTKLSAPTPNCPATDVTSFLMSMQPKANIPVFTIGADNAATILAMSLLFF